MAKQIELSALKGQRMKFTAYFDDYVPYGGNSIVIRLQQVHTPDGEHIIETEFPSEFDLSGNRPVLKRYKRVSDRLLLRVSLKIWPHGTTTGQWITFRATVERARSNTPYYLKSKGYYFARAEKIMIKKIQSRKLIV